MTQKFQFSSLKLDKKTVTALDSNQLEKLRGGTRNIDEPGKTKCKYTCSDGATTSCK